jgi:hypothetical protein
MNPETLSEALALIEKLKIELTKALAAAIN